MNLGKILRLLRITVLIDKSNIPESTKYLLRIVNTIMWMFIVMHLTACSWYYLTDIDKQFVPPFDFYSYNEDYFDFYYQSFPNRYLGSLYNAVIMLGTNEIGPRDNLELAIINFILILMILYNAIVLGDVAVLVQSMSAGSSANQEKIDNANSIMQEIGLNKKA